ncbi:hypothetical protein COV15_02410 [Candidatus Woesearchaeota archaeon CG10_big_fil_rev_8_21_14_0_10_34_12]|nr:MAG: hypothetical protein COV15_02410 [Candidatus Woesearchaeota archaeon CG10_big_fil_rev_8_21_14_0_10_34_12]
MAKKSKKDVMKKQEVGSDSKLFAFIVALLSIVGFIIAILVKKDDEYVMFYAKQALIIFIVFIVAGGITMVPVIGWIIGPVVYLIAIVLWVLSWVYPLMGKKKEVPIVGSLARGLRI